MRGIPLFFLILAAFLFSRCGRNGGDLHQVQLSPLADSVMHHVKLSDPHYDSIRQAFFKAKYDTAAINIINDLCIRYPQYLDVFCHEGMQQSAKHQYEYGALQALVNKGQMLMYKNSIDSAVMVLNECRQKAEQKKWAFLQAQALVLLGSVKVRSSDLAGADELLKQVLEISEKNNYDLISSVAYNMRGQAQLMQYKYKEALEFFHRGMEYAKKAGDNKQVALAYGTMGETYRMNSDYDKAMENYQLSIPFAEKAGAYNIVVNCMAYTAECKRIRGDYVESVRLHEAALGVAEKNNVQSHIASQTIKLGTLYSSIEQKAKARHYLERGIQLTDELKGGNPLDKLHCYCGLVNLSVGEKKFEEARKLIASSMPLAIKVNDVPSQATFESALGDMALEEKNYEEAIKHYTIGKDISLAVGDRINGVGFYNGISRVYFHMGNIQKAEENALLAYKGGLETGAEENVKKGAENLYLVNAKKGNAREALKYLEIFKMHNDSAISDEQAKRFNAAEFEGKEKNMREMQENKDKLYRAEKERKDLEIKQQKTVRNGLIAGGSVLLLLVVVIFKSLQENKKKNRIITEQKAEVESQRDEIQQQKHLVDEKQKEILDSINYAKRIQYALLAQDEMLRKNLARHFVMFRPKDIVSGDFYWATEHKGRFYLAVCDSTGHGVPGAFMCLLNIGFLSEAINENGVREPHEVLNYVRRRLIGSISKEGQKDGFDGILVCFDQETKKMTYAAANNAPVVIGKDGMIELDCDKMPVGQGEKEDSFTLRELKASAGDMVYLYTDGYADQFGGPKGKKFMYKRLNQNLAEISDLPETEQKEKLSATFEEWRGGLEQIDDVCIIGIRI